jgi:hypothetical protein
LSYMLMKFRVDGVVNVVLCCKKDAATEILGMGLRLHFPDVHRSFFLTTSELVERERLDTKSR